jgi:hypothetical protein
MCPLMCLYIFTLFLTKVWMIQILRRRIKKILELENTRREVFVTEFKCPEILINSVKIPLDLYLTAGFCEHKVKVKVKQSCYRPGQALRVQKVEDPRLLDSRHMKVVRMSALRTGRVYPPGNIPSTHFCYRLSQSQGHSATGRIMSMKSSSETIGNRTRDLPVCSAVPEHKVGSINYKAKLVESFFHEVALNKMLISNLYNH